MAVQYVKRFIPPCTDFTIVSATVDNVNSSDSNFTATLRLNIRSKVEFQQWLKEHERLSTFTHRVLKTKPSDGKYVIYKVCWKKKICYGRKFRRPSMIN